MNIYGGVIVGNKEYLNEEIATLDPARGWVYGLHWTYAGDQGWEESNIYAEHNGKTFSSDGRTGLKDFLQWYKQQEFVLQ